MLEALINHPENQDGSKPFAIGQAERMLADAGVTSTGPLVLQPRLDHEREWVRLSEELAFLFAKPLGKTRWEYLDQCLPACTPQLDAYRGAFDRLVLVQLPLPEQNLPLKRILEIVGISDYNTDVLKMEDWKGHKGKFKTPVPGSAWSYATYVEDEERRGQSDRLGVAPLVVRENLTAAARGGTGLDGIFLYVSDRGTLRRHYFDLPGSECGSGYAPCLGLWGAGPRLRLDRVDGAGSRCASVVAGDEVEIRYLAA